MYKLHQKLFSQNFLSNRALTKKLVSESSIGLNDLVLEIGPGTGNITEFLSQRAQHVITVEIDSWHYKNLQYRFAHANNITFYNQDFLGFRLPSLSYKVFANIPFALEGEIVRKLLEDKNPPRDCYLVVRKEFGKRLVAQSQNTMFSIMHTPWFEFSIEHHFSRTDFLPVPKVQAILLRFQRLNSPLLAWNERTTYIKFVREGFKNGVPIINNLTRQFGLQKAIVALLKINAHKKSKPSHVHVNQWICLYIDLIVVPNQIVIGDNFES